MLLSPKNRAPFSRKKRLFLIALVPGIAGVLVYGFLTRAGYWLATPSTIHPADAIVVHGGGIDREKYGVELYQQGLAPELWLTGLNTQAITGPTRAARQRAIDAGVPSEAIHMLATTSTWEDGREIAALARQREVTSLLIVTDWWHSRRAICANHHHLRKSGVSLYYAASPSPSIEPAGWWKHPYNRKMVLLELGKTAFYWLYYGLNPWTC